MAIRLANPAPARRILTAWAAAWMSTASAWIQSGSTQVWMRTCPWSGLPKWLTTTCSRFSLVSPLAMMATRFPPLGCIAFRRARAAAPVAELEFRASGASGPGGQGVNATDSRVELRFDLAGSPSLTDEAKELAVRRLGPRLDSGGVLRVVAQAQRSQLANRRAAVERFAELLAAALATPRARRPTRPTRASAAPPGGTKRPRPPPHSPPGR